MSEGPTADREARVRSTNRLASTLAGVEAIIFGDVERRGVPLWLIGAIFALGVLARLWTLAADSLWADELYSWAVTRMDLGRILIVPFDVHPPLYYALLKLVTAFGQSEFALRAPSALCGLATVALVFEFARRHLGPRAALVGAGVVLFSFKHIVHSSTTRNYALLLMLCVAASWALAALADRVARGKIPLRLATGYAFLAFGALMTHTIAAIYLVVLSGAVFAAFGLANLRRAPAIAGVLAAANAPGFAVFALWYLGARQSAADFGWLQAFGPAEATKIYLSVFTPNGLPVAVMALCGLCVALGLWASLRRTPMAYWVPTAAMLLLLPAALFLMNGVRPLYMDRTILLTVPGAGLALAGLIATLRPRRLADVLGIILVAAYGASALTYVFRDKSDEFYGTQAIQDLRGTMKIVDRELTPGAVVLTCAHFMEPMFRYYGSRPPYATLIFLGHDEISVPLHNWADYFGEPAPARPKDWAANRPGALAPYRSVLYLDTPMFCAGIDPQSMLIAQGFAVGPADHVQGVTIRRFTRPAG